MTEVMKMTETSAAPGTEPHNTVPADPMVSMIERIAKDPNADLEKLERMLAMKERMEDRAREDEDRAAKRAFYAALSHAQSAIPVVLKNKNNDQTRSKYADLAAIEDQAMPVIREHGFSISAWPVPGAGEGMQRVRFRVAHEEGHTDEIEDDFPLDATGAKGVVNKTALHAKGSTASYARRYFVVGYFNIATSDDDGNLGGGKATETITADQYLELRDLIEAAGIAEEVVCRAENVTMLDVLPAKKFSHVKAQLQTTIKNRSRANG